MGNAYYYRLHGSRDNNLEKAIFHFSQTLEVYSRKDFPKDWAQTHNNLGSACRERIMGNKAENSAQAIFHYQQAIEEYNLQKLTVELRLTSRSLGNLAFSLEDWELARDAYRQAFKSHRILMDATFSPLSKQVEIEEMNTLSSKLAYTFLQLNQTKQAVECLEQGRAQMMRDALERQRKSLMHLPELGFRELYDKFMTAVGKETILQEVEIDHHDLEWQAEIEGVRQEILATADAIRKSVGEKGPQIPNSPRIPIL